MRTFCALAIVCTLYANARAQSNEKPTAAAKPKGKAPAVKIEPRAQELLKEMSSYLAGIPKLSVHVASSRELVVQDGLKVQFHAATDIALQRPDKLSATIKLGDAEAIFLYDGRNYTVHKKGGQYFATAEAPPNIDKAIELARERLEVDAPTADLLLSDPYAVLTEGVTAGAYLGTDNIDGTSCHHLIFRQPEVDWQIWIEDGARPLPRKMVITSKDLQSAPQFEAFLDNWNLSPTLTADTFQFKPPEGSIQVDFMKVKDAKDKAKTQAKTKQDPTGGVR